MIYDPTIYNEWEWGRTDYLLFHDPVLYAWMYWESQSVRERLMGRLEMTWPETHLSPMTRYQFGFSYGTRRDDTPFVVPPT